ncbi:hypothetical protein HYDPIDRAFT_48209, partial [Hydnomerulius pinastri MD-312]
VLVKTLFVRIVPNTTAWTEALETFLDGHGYELKIKNSLRQRFSNAYHWYCVLIIQNDDHLSSLYIALPINPLADFFLCKIDCIVCIDANFTQKWSKNPWGAQGQDPSNPMPVNALDDEDVVEKGMRIPVSVLEGCGESFTAADERREKASTQFFADTGLMAMLCRHDRVLWLVNMSSAGEKQYYALALVQKLMDHLPSDMRVGLLYDI